MPVGVDDAPDQGRREDDIMRKSMVIVAACSMLAACSTAARTGDGEVQPSASIPSPDVAVSPVGVWRGTASETQSIYSGPASAAVTLDLRPDGSYTQVWTARGESRSERGRWSVRGRNVVLDGIEPNVNRTLRYSGNALFGTTAESQPAQGRVGTQAISLTRAT
jgi:hypothetical protein